MKRAKKAPKVEKVVEMFQVVLYEDARRCKYDPGFGKTARGFSYEHSMELALGVKESPVYVSIPLGAWYLARTGGTPVDALTAEKRWNAFVNEGGRLDDGLLVRGSQ